MPPKSDQKTSKGKKKEVKVEMSEEDQKKKQELEDLVVKIKTGNKKKQTEALEVLKKELQQTSSSVTSIPKPLKFLGSHYQSLKKFYAENVGANSDIKPMLADILSVLGMTMSKENERDTLNYKLQGTTDDLSKWGHEYLRYLSGEIGLEYQHRLNDHYEKEEKQQQEGAMQTELPEPTFDDLMKLVDLIIPIMMKSQSESDACDLLIEVEKLEKIVPFCDKNNHQRVCLYLISCSKYLLYPDNIQTLKVVHTIYKNLNKFPEALRISLLVADDQLIKETFDQCKDNQLMQKQLAFILAEHNTNLAKGEEDEDEDMDDINDDDDEEEEEEDDENKVSNIMGKSKYSEHFLYLAKELDSLEPKTPESIYKSHLSEVKSSVEKQIDSSRQNLASSFVNAFLNAGYNTDTLMTEEDSKWLYKNKGHGLMSTAASLGLLYKWNTEEGFTTIHKYNFSGDNYIRGGALLATGICNSGVEGEIDSGFALLSEHVEDKSRELRIGSILGLGIGYAGTKHEGINEILLPILADSEQPIDIAAFTALSLSMIFVGTCNEDISSTIIEVLSERTDAVLKGPLVTYLCLSLGLLFLGKEEQADAIIETIESALSPVVSKFCSYVVQVCSTIGSGNVLKVQQLLKVCSEHILAKSTEKTENDQEQPDESSTSESKTDSKTAPASSSKNTSSSPSQTEDSEKEEVKKEDNRHQAIAVLGIAMVAMGEDIGKDMVVRTMNHLLQYGDINVKRAVPLALALLNVSNPDMVVMDTLSKLTHDSDVGVSQNAILSLGIIGAGSNNARIAQLLRQLSVYYSKESDYLFLTKISQGLLFMGKGLLTLSPLYSDKLLTNNVSIGGILVTLFSALNMKETILGQYHYLLYFLSCSMNSRMLVTVNEELKPIKVSVRVGQAVDQVGQAGKPKSITGFQTHDTPVVLQYGERAELATEEYLPLNSTLEGVVILKKNPDFVDV